MPTEVALWLIQVDAFFRVTRITNQRERLDYVLIHMGQDPGLLAVVKLFLEERMYTGTSPWDSLKIEIENNLDSHSPQLPDKLYTSYENECKDKVLNVF